MALKKDPFSTGSGTKGNTQAPNGLYSVLTNNGIVQSTTKPTYSTNSFGGTNVSYTKPINNGTSSTPVTHISIPTVATPNYSSNFKTGYSYNADDYTKKPTNTYNKDILLGYDKTSGKPVSVNVSTGGYSLNRSDYPYPYFSIADDINDHTPTQPPQTTQNKPSNLTVLLAQYPNLTIDANGNIVEKTPTASTSGGTDGGSLGTILGGGTDVSTVGTPNAIIGDLSNKYGTSVNELSWYIDQFKQRNPDLFDFTSYDNLLASLENAYNNNVTSIEEAFNLLQDKLNRQRQENAKAFAKGRVTASENAYDTARQQQMALASRGLAGSGLQQLGEVQNRMELGRQLNDLADSYYQASQNLNDTEKEAVLNKAQQLRSLSDQLSTSQAQVNIQRQNAVTQANSLAEQLSMSQRAQDLSNAQFYDSMDNSNYWNSQSFGLQREQLEMQKQQLAQSMNDIELQYMNSANAISLDSSLTQTEKVNLMNNLDEAYRGYSDGQKFNKMSSLAWATLNSENDKVIAELDNDTKDGGKFLTSIINAKKLGQITVDESNFDNIYNTYKNKRLTKGDTSQLFAPIKSKAEVKKELGL